MAKATLAQRKAKPNSKYWKDKADDLWSDEIRKVGCCEVCGKDGGFRQKDGAQVVGLQAHHLIRRGRLRYRYDLTNGVCLCIANHGSHPNYRNNKLCAHGSEAAQEAFMEWLETERSGVYGWWLEHKDNMRLMEGSFRDKYEELLEIK